MISLRKRRQVRRRERERDIQKARDKYFFLISVPALTSVLFIRKKTLKSCTPDFYYSLFSHSFRRPSLWIASAWERRVYGNVKEMAWWWRAINRAIKCRMLLMTVAELIKLPVLQFCSLKLHFSTHKSQITARHAISHTNHFIFARRSQVSLASHVPIPIPIWHIPPTICLLVRSVY